MRLLHHGPIPEHADFTAFFRIFPGKAGAPLLVAGGSLLLAHQPAQVKRRTSKQSAAHRLAPSKPAGDLLVSGRAYSDAAHYGHAKAVRVAVEMPSWRWRKELAVFGDRVWLPGLVDAAPSEPKPFQSVPLDYAHAYGGEGYAWNPIGLGKGPGERGLRVPNIEFSDRPITSSSSAPGPAGFGPIAASWQPRAGRSGTFNEDWRIHHWPGMPADMAPSYWNEAPADQQFPGGFRGDEVIGVHNMHPEQRNFTLSLPSLRCRLFLKKRDGAFAELPAMLDVVDIDMAEGHTELVWRGTAPVETSRLRDAAFLFALLEPLREQATPAQCETWFEQARSAKYPTADELAARAAQAKTAGETAQAARRKESEDIVAGIMAELGETRRAARERMASLLAKAGVELPPQPEPQPVPPAPEPPAWTRERVLEALAAGGKSFAGADLSSLDLSGADFSGVNLAGARLVGTWLQNANFTGATLTGISAEGALFSGANLTQARVGKAGFRGAFFAKANLAGVDFSGADLGEAHFESALAASASFAKAKLQRANFRTANLEKADFHQADATQAVFDGALLSKANFYGATAPGASFQRCVMLNLRAAEADFRHAHFADANAPSSLWRRAHLEGADFTRAILTCANFSEASLAQACFDAALLETADFGEVVMTQARARAAKLLRASFDRADLRGTDFSGANLYQAGFARAHLAGATLEHCLLASTVLAR